MPQSTQLVVWRLFCLNSKVVFAGSISVAQAGSDADWTTSVELTVDATDVAGVVADTGHRLGDHNHFATFLFFDNIANTEKGFGVQRVVYYFHSKTEPINSKLRAKADITSTISKNFLD